jgi:ketosteroid isomerase-like protein
MTVRGRSPATASRPRTHRRSSNSIARVAAIRVRTAENRSKIEQRRQRVAASLYIKSALAAASLMASAAFAAHAQTSAESSTEKAAIGATVTSYEAAMNTDALIALYAEDGVLMPPYTHSVVGKAAVREAYVAGAKVFLLDVKFNIAEVVQMAPDWAFIRTNSKGTMKIKATGTTSEEANQELFILRKELGGEWKIASYSFSSTNPAPKQ